MFETPVKQLFLPSAFREITAGAEDTQKVQAARQHRTGLKTEAGIIHAEIIDIIKAFSLGLAIQIYSIPPPPPGTKPNRM